MKTCSFSSFQEIITPWLSSDYIRKIFKNDKDHLTLLFTDGVTDTYHIEDCTDVQLEELFEDLKKKGIQIGEDHGT